MICSRNNLRNTLFKIMLLVMVRNDYTTTVFQRVVLLRVIGIIISLALRLSDAGLRYQALLALAIK